MAGRRRLTLKEIYPEEEIEEAGNVALQGSVTGRRRLNLKDIYPEEYEEKPEAPFVGGSTLQVTTPLPGDWETYDTGVPIGQSTAQLLAGAGKRFTDISRRGRQLARRPGVQEEIDQAEMRDRPLMATTPGMVGHMLPDIIATAPLTGGALSGYRAGAGLGAAQGLSMPVTGEDNSFLNLGMGALGGTLGTAMGRGLAGLGGKVANLAPGAIPPSMRAAAARRGVNLPEVQWRDDEARRLYELGQAGKVRLSIGDLDPRSRWRGTESLMENLPSGRARFLERQQQDMRNNVESLRGSFTGPRGNQGADIATGIKDQYNQFRNEASKRFKIVDAVSKGPGIEPVKPLETYAAAQDALAQHPDIFNEFKNSKFMRRVLGIERDTGPQPGMIINPKTNQPFKYDQKLSFEEAQYVRKQLGAWVGKMQDQMDRGTLPEGVNRESVAQASKIFSAFDNDLDRWGMQAGPPGTTTVPTRTQALNSAWQDAREYFKENVIPYRDPDALESKTKLVRNIIGDKVDVETIPAKALPTRETSIASDVMDLSAPGGQQAMKSALINKMTDESLVPEGLDTAALMRHTTKHGHSGESVFSPDEIARIQATRDLAKATGRSGDLSRIHDSGGRLVSTLLGGGAMVGVPWMGLQLANSADAEMAPWQKAAFSFAALPAAVALGSRGLNAYTSHPRFHFADPELSGFLGALQRYGMGTIRAAGQPTLEEWRSGELGHRP